MPSSFWSDMVASVEYVAAIVTGAAPKAATMKMTMSFCIVEELNAVSSLKLRQLPVGTIFSDTEPCRLNLQYAKCEWFVLQPYATENWELSVMLKQAQATAKCSATRPVAW